MVGLCRLFHFEKEESLSQRSIIIFATIWTLVLGTSIDLVIFVVTDNKAVVAPKAGFFLSFYRAK